MEHNIFNFIDGSKVLRFIAIVTLSAIALFFLVIAGITTFKAVKGEHIKLWGGFEINMDEKKDTVVIFKPPQLTETPATAPKKEEPKPKQQQAPKNEQKATNINVTSNDQHGGQTAGQINNN